MGLIKGDTGSLEYSCRVLIMEVGYSKSSYYRCGNGHGVSRPRAGPPVSSPEVLRGLQPGYHLYLPTDT